MEFQVEELMEQLETADEARKKVRKELDEALKKLAEYEKSKVNQGDLDVANSKIKDL